MILLFAHLSGDSMILDLLKSLWFIENVEQALIARYWASERDLDEFRQLISTYYNNSVEQVWICILCNTRYLLKVKPSVVLRAVQSQEPLPNPVTPEHALKSAQGPCQVFMEMLRQNEKDLFHADLFSGVIIVCSVGSQELIQELMDIIDRAFVPLDEHVRLALLAQQTRKSQWLYDYDKENDKRILYQTMVIGLANRFDTEEAIHLIKIIFKKYPDKILEFACAGIQQGNSTGYNMQVVKYLLNHVKDRRILFQCMVGAFNNNNLNVAQYVYEQVLHKNLAEYRDEFVDSINSRVLGTFDDWIVEYLVHEFPEILDKEIKEAQVKPHLLEYLQSLKKGNATLLHIEQ
jgi:hypothetical protein